MKDTSPRILMVIARRISDVAISVLREIPSLRSE